MKNYRVIFVVIAVLCFAAVAGASTTDMRIIFDPGSTFVDPTDIFQTNVAVAVPWVSCSETGIPAALSGETACLAMNNLTGSALTSLDVSFTVPTGSPLVGQVINCENTDAFLTTNNCDAAGTLTAGQVLDLVFSGGEAVPNDTDFFFGAEAAGLTDPGQFPPVTVDPMAAPEPSSLLLLAAGLAIFSLGMAYRRRFA